MTYDDWLAGHDREFIYRGDDAMDEEHNEMLSRLDAWLRDATADELRVGRSMVEAAIDLRAKRAEAEYRALTRTRKVRRDAGKARTRRTDEVVS